MASLLDIAPAGKTVSVQGKDVLARGVSAAGLAQLLARFPDLRRLVSGKGEGITLDALFGGGNDLVAAILAAGTGSPGDAEAEAVAAALPLDEQADLLAAILELTLPRGIGPFAQRLERLTNLLGADSVQPGKAPDTKSRKG